MKICAVIALLATPAWAADFPQAEISNGVITAKFYLPDAEKGYYRGTRFDWAGQIYSLRALGNEYFGQWFDRYDPQLHDSIMGPVEEFTTGEASLGYDEAPVGGTFIRIGIGTVRKPEEKAYQRFRTYEIIDSGKRTVRQGDGWIEFTHDLDGKNGYAYRYVKTIRLTSGKPEMVIEHSLQNNGTKKIETSQYNHNFFVMNQQPTGTESKVIFPFELRAKRPFANNLAEARGKEIVYTQELPKGPNTFAEFEGFGKTASDYDVRLENKKAGTGVRITSDRPISKLIYWSIRTTFCPEAYIDIAVDPGKRSDWKYTYNFYQVQ